MKIKSLLIGMLACSAMVACTNTDELEVDNGKGKDGHSYLAVKFSMDGKSSRALGRYAEGTTDEVKVTKATFFFLDETGNSCADPCTIAGSQLDSWTPGTSDNTNKDANTSVDETSAPVVVIKNAVKTPTQIVAILNPVEDYTSGKSLAELEAISGTGFGVTESGKFVMSNSVYAEKGKKVIATTIPGSSIKNTPEAAIGANVPVVIPVERVLAKVNFATNNVKGSEEVELDRESASAEIAKTRISVEVTGYHLYKTYNTSYLFKNINPTWAGNWWNDATYHRSYWAINATGGEWDNTKAYDGADMSDKYCQENTDADNKTKLLAIAVLKADLTDDNKDNPTDISLVKYRGAYYTEKGFLAEVAKLYDVTKYYVKDGDGHRALAAKDLTLAYNTITTNITVGGSAIQDYQAVPALASTITEVYTLDADKYVAANLDNVKAAINSIVKVKYWKNGRAYFFTDIEHGGAGCGVTEGGNEAQYGIVRNHLYRLTLTSIKGFGTPAPGDKPIVPTTPEDDEETYLAAQVEILSYKVVTQNVTLQ